MYASYKVQLVVSLSVSKLTRDHSICFGVRCDYPAAMANLNNCGTVVVKYYASNITNMWFG